MDYTTHLIPRHVPRSRPGQQPECGHVDEISDNSRRLVQTESQNGQFGMVGRYCGQLIRLADRFEETGRRPRFQRAGDIRPVQSTDDR